MAKRQRNDGIRKACECGRRRWSICAHARRLNFKWGDTHYRLAIDREINRKLKDRSEAKAEADKIRTAIRNGVFRQATPSPAAPADLTFAKFGALWIERERDGKVAKLALKREKHARRVRRLVADESGKDGKVKTPGEARRLLAASTPWMQRLIIAAICCRRGELLSLQWADVSLQANTITIRAEKAKDGDRRVLPVSQRLKGVLEMVRHDPDGKEHSPAAFVFGDAIGEKTADPKKAWVKACTTAGAPPRARDAGTRRSETDEHVSQRDAGRAAGFDAALRHAAVALCCTRGRFGASARGQRPVYETAASDRELKA